MVRQKCYQEWNGVSRSGKCFPNEILIRRQTVKQIRRNLRSVTLKGQSLKLSLPSSSRKPIRPNKREINLRKLWRVCFVFFFKLATIFPGRFVNKSVGLRVVRI